MIYNKPKNQEKQSTNPKDYKVRIIVAGTRKWKDKKLFHEIIVDYLERFSEPVLFISGAANSGADRFIIDWCKKYNYPCLEMPADWDTHGKSAGYVRNTEMAEIGTHLVCFWDTVSRGTAHMRTVSSEKHLNIMTVLVKVEE
jgi:hypothetical protein